MTTPTCATCRFWDNPRDFFEISVARCRRFPPVIVDFLMHPKEDEAVDFNDPADATFGPVTQENDWCGEHQPKQKPKRKH